MQIRSGYPHSFNISRFDPQATDMVYEGDVRPNVGTIDFTSSTYYCHVGPAFYAEKPRLWDSASGRLTDFSTRFSFTIDTRNQSVYGAGMAFFLFPVGLQIPVNSVGGFLGLFNTTYSDSSLNQIVAVEFDTFANPEWDPPYEHVRINKNSIASAVTTPWNASFHSGDAADAWIAYDSATRNLSVSWSYQTMPNPHENTSISYQIDLTIVLERKLGEGRFGGVYRGYLVGLDVAVAVKRISRGSKQGKKEFITEVKVISSLRHRNLVQLIGWCQEANEFLLVYEFMPNGCLDRHLFGKKSPLDFR